VTTYQWDPNGNLTEQAISTGSVTTYTWDALNRLSTLDDTTGHHSYGYDPTGIRVRETNGADTTRFLHAQEDIVASYKAGTLQTYYTHGPGIDEPWAQVSADAPEPVAYLHRDGLGSVTAISNPNAQLRGTTTYAAFGQVEQATGLKSRYGYTSRELDPTGLMYYRARYYQPEVGRFASQDTSEGTVADPPSLHLYAYVQNIPTGLSDPAGNEPGTSPVLGGGDVGLLLIIAPYLLILGLLARIAKNTFAPILLNYFRAIHAWMVVVGLVLEEYFLAIRVYLGGQLDRVADYVARLAIIGLAFYFAGIFRMIQLVTWTRTGASFLAFTVYLYAACASLFPSGNLLEVLVSREAVICASILFYIWAIVNLPEAPVKDL